MVTQASFSDQNLTTQKTVAFWTPEEDFVVQSDDLYFISDNNGFIKIGRTRNIRDRLKTLRSGNAHSLTLLRALKNCGWQEPIWHKAFGLSFVRGEWFEDNEGLRSAIADAEEDGDAWCYAVPIPSRYEHVFTLTEARAIAPLVGGLNQAKRELWGDHWAAMLEDELYRHTRKDRAQ